MQEDTGLTNNREEEVYLLCHLQDAGMGPLILMKKENKSD